MYMIFKTYFKLLAVISLVPMISCQENSPPYSVEDSLNTFELPEGFRIELVAAEPLIKDPVDISFDADGKMYVAEMPDYPTDENNEPFSRVMLLEDSNGDGQFDTSTVFAEDLPFVNGVLAWGDGVLVTKAPDIIYYEDTNGDGRADVRRVILSGFAVTNPQLRMSSLRYGFDNWIYGAYSRASAGRGFPEHAGTGHPLIFPGNPDADSVDITPGTDFRFRPDEFKVESSGGMSQFGLSFDADGNRYTVWNNDHIRHVVIDHRYVERNPYHSISSVMAPIAEHGGSASIFPITEDGLELHESEIGHFTSACGNSIYTADTFSSDYSNASFVCEPASNMVHVDLLSQDGATFMAQRDNDEAEFLASTDSWFRPVNSTIGPDGALYVVDMYRKLIEHPAWIAHSDDDGYHTHAGTLQLSDFHEGQNYGRIYRIIPEDYKQEDSEKPNLRSADAENLVSQLENPNRWWRITAQQLLVAQEDLAVIPMLEELFTRSSSAFAKIHALWTLEGLGNLDDRLVLTALDDESSTVRKQAVILSESRLENINIKKKLLEMVNDPEDHVQFQIALTASDLPNDQTFDALQKIALQHIDDSWFHTAILLNVSENPLQWFQAVTGFDLGNDDEISGKEEFLHKVASITGVRAEAGEISELISFIKQINEPSFQISSLEGLVGGMQRGDAVSLTRNGQSDLMELITGSTQDVQNAALEVATYIEIVNSQAVQNAVTQAQKILSDEDPTIDEKTHAVKLIGLDPDGLKMGIFDDLLRPQQPIDVQMAAARILIRSDDNRAIDLLIDRWDSYTSTIREVVENGILGRQDHVFSLIEAIEDGKIYPSSLNPSSRSRLAQHSDDEIQTRAKIAFANLLDDNRDDVITEYFKATTLSGDASNGRSVFIETCSICHQAGRDIGNAVGPDLRSVVSQTRVNLLTKIIKPNDYTTAGYEGYIVETTGGRTVTGVMVQETSTNVILRAPGGTEHAIQRNNIQSARPMATSIMPEGLESNMSIQEMADLFEFIKSLE